jgi:hypothetical protein
MVAHEGRHAADPGARQDRHGGAEHDDAERQVAGSAIASNRC